jgi:hypothetical protein
MANPRISTTIESGRKYDIDFMNWDQGVEGYATFTFGTLSKKTTGLVKSVNRFMKILLTRKGTDPFNLQGGTLFDELSDMGGDTIEVLGTFAAEQISECLSQVQKIQSTKSLPLDENLVNVTLTNVVQLSNDKVAFYIKFLAESGANTTVKLPIIGG